VTVLKDGDSRWAG